MILSPFVLTERRGTETPSPWTSGAFARSADLPTYSSDYFPSGILSNQRLGLLRLGLLRYRVSRLGLVGLGVA